jgi:radical SAM superfamily enzyme YgiQ (UPF0313 family)
MGRRVLLVNPAKEDNFSVNRIHMGLTLIGQILKSNGHEVKIMDYAFLRDLKRKIRVPGIEEVIHEFKPDVIGLSVFTYLYDECQALIERISHCCNIPIILGGPHLTIFPKDFSGDSRISYIVRGEAESIILNLIETAKREQPPVFIDCPLPSPDEIPSANIDIAYGSQYLQNYQIQLSRGCPFNCAFCNVNLIAGRKVRARDLSLCLDQILEAKRHHPNIQSVYITDDCPTFNKARFKQFLRMHIEQKVGLQLAIDNVRADLIDDEFLSLYVSANGVNICLGVESGHPEVFKFINKGERLEEIIQAAKLVRKHNLSLGLCFVIGLPGDSLERHLYSLRLAKSLKPDYIFWNMCIPWPGTLVNQWYQTHGEIGDLRNFSTLIDPKVNFREPVCSSPNFPKEDMIKAWLMANMETYYFSLYGLKNLFLETIRHKLYRSFVIYIRGYIFHVIRTRLTAIQRNLKQFGIYFVIVKVLRKILNAR